MTILNYLKDISKIFSEKIAYRYVDRNANVIEEVTYSKLWCNTRHIAAQIKLTNSCRSRVLLLLPAESSFIQFFLGTILADLIAVPCPVSYSQASIHRILNIIDDCSATAIITNFKTYNMLFKRGTPASEQLKQLDIQWIFTEGILAIAPQILVEEEKLNADNIAYLQYTSGSTSAPKGVMITHKNLVRNLEAIDAGFARTSNDCSVTWLPHYHDMGLVDGLLSPLFTGGTGIVIAPLDFVSRPSVWLNCITKYAVSHTGGPNFGIQLCTRNISQVEFEKLDLSSLRILYVGAEPIKYTHLLDFSNRFASVNFRSAAFVPAYGLAECTLAVSLHQTSQALFFKNLGENESKKVIGCGPPVLHAQIEIVAPDSKDIVTDIAGEIWVSGESVALGYWNNELATKNTFNAFTSCGKGPFMRTGDLGFVADDQLFITGRIKEIIIINGVNYYPYDIEDVISINHACVQENAIAAFSIDSRDGECLAIALELKRSASKEVDHDIIKLEISKYVGMAFGIVPKEIYFLDTGKIPKTSSGKIQRLKLREKYNHQENTLSN